MLISPVRAGSRAVCSALNSHSKVVCHRDLLHEDLDTRVESHVTYFDVEDYYRKEFISIESYLSHHVFDKPKYGEVAVGVTLDYPTLDTNQLWEYLAALNREGDFCVIHLKRNPIACFLSLKQAESTGVWFADLNSKPTPDELKLFKMIVDHEELTDFVRTHEMNESRVDLHCSDRLELSYRELITGSRKVFDELFRFLDLTPLRSVKPATRKLQHRHVRDRISDPALLRLNLPQDVLKYFNADLI